MTQHGHVVWIELNTRDPEIAKRFYADTIGWTADPMDMPEGGTYWVLKAEGTAAAGVFTMAGPMFDGVPDHWLTYVEVDDIDARTSRVEAAGGQIIRAPWTVPGVGRIAILRAPGGAVMGWMTSVPRP